jgi:2,5-diketo-D-gluconate reductase B
MPSGEAQPVVEGAIVVGLRHINTAAMYENETAVGAAIPASGVKRAEPFVTTKVWHDQLSPDALHRAFDISLGMLRLDYVDLYITHWPSRDMDMAATLEALMELRERGLTGAIADDSPCVEEIGAPIATHQVEYYPFLSRAPMTRLSAQQGHSVDRLRASRARPSGERCHARRNRPQAWRERRAGSGRPGCWTRKASL